MWLKMDVTPANIKSQCSPRLSELHLQVGDELVRLELEVIYPAVANLRVSTSISIISTSISIQL